MKFKHTCEVCGKEFEVPLWRENQAKANGFHIRFCSRKCFASQSTIVVCEVCGKSLGPVWNSRKSTGRGKFCSMECYRISRRGKPISHPRVEKIPYTCINCGKEFMVNPCKIRAYEERDKRIRFCSQQCRLEIARIASRSKFCLHCGAPLGVIPLNRIRAGRGKFCGRQCKAEFWRAFNLGPRKGHFSVNQKKRIFERDNYECVLCGCEIPDELECDHIVPVHRGGKNVVDNGQVLCRSCHRGKTARERSLIAEEKREKVESFVEGLKRS